MNSVVDIGTPARSAKDTGSPVFGAADYNLPQPTWVVPKQTHLKTAMIAYQALLVGNNGPPTDQTILKNYVDLVITNPTVVAQCRGALADTQVMLLTYTILSDISWYSILDWVLYADANSAHREQGFFHAAAPYVNDTTWGAQAFPANWFWDARLWSQNAQSFTPWYNTSINININTPSFLTDNSNPSLGNIVGDALWVGYPEKFCTIEFTGHTYSGSAWARVYEYPTAVDGNGVPSTWGTITVLSDTSNNFQRDGEIHFTPPSDWVKSQAAPTNPGGIDKSGLLAFSPQWQPRLGYYVRIRTTNPGVPPSIARMTLRDFLGQSKPTQLLNDTPNMTFPSFDAAVDADRDGYLNETEWNNPARDPSKTARFLYESRMYTFEGSNQPFVNMLYPPCQVWAGLTAIAGEYQTAADGVYVDNAGDSILFNAGITIEDTTNYEEYWGGCLRLIWKLMQGGSPYGHSRVALPNMGANPRAKIIGRCPAYYSEGLFNEADSWMDFEAKAGHVSDAAAMYPQGLEPLQVVDSITSNAFSAGPTTTQLMVLFAAYRLVQRPNTYFGCCLSGPFTQSNWNGTKWLPAFTADMGAIASAGVPPVYQGTTPTVGGVYDYALDPSDSFSTKHYKTYYRVYPNATVYYRPNSVSAGGAIGALGAGGVSYSVSGYPLQPDGTHAVHVTSITLANGQAVILMNASS